ncbi:hypothetical protein GCM10009839_23300 [Catenulispora yoronensis]|uniref:Tox-REase-5 domain-containing protein n=1 Tax=Catenulispora yoronensis TaxID=450799 RepID=A0ABN2TYD2_9ACTN
MANPEKKIISKLTSLTGHFHGVGEHTGGSVNKLGTHLHGAAERFDDEERKLAHLAEGEVGKTARKAETEGAQTAEHLAADAAAARSVRPPKAPKLKPGTDEHRADRWAKYQKRTSTPEFEKKVAEGGRPALSKEAWDNNYDANWNKAKKAQAQVENFADRAGHKKEDGWLFGNNQEEHSITFPDGSVRRIDIAHPDRQIGIEYKGGRINNSEDIRKEVELDGRLAAQGWDIRWVGQTPEPPAWLKPELDKHGISWHHDDGSNPFHYRRKR